MALDESNKSKPWKLHEFGLASFAFQFEQYTPRISCTATYLQIWSRLVLRYPFCHQEQQENIPLRPKDLPPASQQDLNSSVDESDGCSTYCDSCFPGDTKVEPLTFNMHFEDQTYVKQLEYSSFSRWESVEALLAGLEGDGAVIEGLWDVREDMPIGSGDWDARVYPGLEVDVTCWKPGDWEDEPSEYGSDAEAEDEEEPSTLWDSGRHHAKRWWFRRWRMKVEQEAIGAGGPVHEPPQRTILLGVLAMAAFLGIVFVFCAV